MSRCGDCEKKLTNLNVTEIAICGNCKAKYHFQCVKISASSWKSMGPTRQLIWSCPKCREKKKKLSKSVSESENGNDDVQTNSAEEDEVLELDEEVIKKIQGNEELIKILRDIVKKIDDLKEIKVEVLSLTKVVSEMKTEVRDLTTAMNDHSDEIEGLKKENDVLKKKIQEIESKAETNNFNNMSEHLTKKMDDMKQALNEKEQYDRNRNIEINNLIMHPNENLPKIVGKLATELGISTYRHEMVDAAHRLPSNNKNRPPALIVQFKFRMDRDAWILARKNSVTNDRIYGDGNNSRVFVNENMTPYFRTLFWQSKNFAKENNYKYVWFFRGRIWMRQKDGERAIIIKSIKDLNVTHLTHA